MEESKNITLPLGDVSWKQMLGVYYIDMRPAIIHYTSNIWNGGFDDKCVPFCSFPDYGVCYFPINIAQYGFILHAQYLEKKDSKLLDKLKNCIEKLNELKCDKGDYSVWYHEHYNHKYSLNPPWASAMAQGEIISFYLRMYQLFDNDEYLQTAIRAYKFLRFEHENGGVRRYDEQGNLWLEEYPSTPPSYVLNGFIYALFGLIDLHRVQPTEAVKADIDACILTLKLNLHKFDTGYWSKYDLLKEELVRYYYQKNVHVPQMEILYKLTHEPIFDFYFKKWKRNIHPINFLFVQVMYRIQPRLRKFNLLLRRIWKR